MLFSGSIALTDSNFDEQHAVLLLYDVNCNGSESSLLNCEHNQLMQTNCGPLEDAGVVCQGRWTEALAVYGLWSTPLALSTTAGSCEDGEVRLSGGMSDDLNFTMDGRLEICYNNAWGTVCNNFFRAVDARVACNQLPGFNRQGMINFSNFFVINKFVAGGMTIAPREFIQFGPIFLDQLFCTDSDTTLEECSRGIAGIGLTSCNHTEDVWIQCSGNSAAILYGAGAEWCYFRY